MVPRVTFVVPCYNYGRFVAQAIESLLSQTFDAIEVLVVDDASTDDSMEVIERYRDDARVRIIRHVENRGHIHSYNEGLALARGEFIGLLSADDFCVHNDAVARQVDLFDTYPRVGLVYSAYSLADQQGQSFSVSRPWDTDHVWPGAKEFAQLLFGNYVPASGPLVRRRCHEEVGYYDERLPHAGDWEMWLRLAARYDVAFIADPLYAYRTHPTNMHYTAVSPSQATDEDILTIQTAFAALPPDAPRTLWRLRQLALRRALLNSTNHDFKFGRTKRSWIGLLYAAWRSPRLVVSPTFTANLGRLTLLTLLGHPRYVSLHHWRRHPMWPLTREARSGKDGPSDAKSPVTPVGTSSDH